jgi:hypothetical protein
MEVFNLKKALLTQVKEEGINLIAKDEELCQSDSAILADTILGLGEIVFSYALSEKPSLVILNFEDLILIRHFLNKILVAGKPMLLMALYNDLPKRQPFPVPYFEMVSYFHYPPAIHLWPKNLEEAVLLINTGFNFAYQLMLPVVVLTPLSFFLAEYNRFPVVSLKIAKQPGKKTKKSPVVASSYPSFREEEIYAKIERLAKAEQFHKGSETLIVASGPLAQRIETYMESNRLEVGLFRPIFLSPFPKKLLAERLGMVKRVFLLDQFIPYFVLVEKGLKKQAAIALKRFVLPPNLSDEDLIRIISGLI